MGSIRIFLLGVDLTHNRSVGDFFSSVLRYVIVLDGKEGVRVGNSFASPVWTYSNALAETAKFIGCRGRPNLGEAWVTEELAVVEILTCVCVENRHDQV